MNDKYFGYSRKWLNPIKHLDTGALEWHVYTWGSNGTYINADLSIWDCGKKISLSLDCDAKDIKDCEQRAQKLDTIINELNKMKAAMAKAYEFAYPLTLKEDENDE